MRLLRALEQATSSPNAPAFTVKDWVLVLVAALCHDLGHPAFSHTWETFMNSVYADGDFMQRIYGDEASQFKEWDHEDASQLMLEALW